MSDVLLFRDVSNWDGDYRPTGATIAKATEGTSFRDPYYPRNRDRTKAGGWPFAGYHYVNTTDPTAQAANAYAVIGSGIPAMWDIEKGGGTLAHLCATHDAYTHKGGHARLVYLPRWYWSGYLGSPSLQPLIDRKLILVASDYRDGYGPAARGWQPYGGMTPRILQYSSDNGDRNAFYGTTTDLANLLGQMPAAPPPPKLTWPVQTGDTMTKIANGWGVTLDALEKANPHAGHPAGNYNIIWPGDIIHHP